MPRRKRTGARVVAARGDASARERLARALCRERRARRQAQAEARAKDELLATVSHELRTPLGAILIWTQLLRAERGAQEDRALDMIERSTKSLAQIVDDLLDAARIVAGKLRVDREPLDLGTVVAAAVESARLGAEARGVEMVVRVASNVPPVNGDAARLQQVAANLISNAVKFTSRGGRVEVALSRSGDQAVLVVADTGVGIEPAFLPHIFERFRQADSTSTRHYKGLGLGLAIARHLVELHGGTIEADSAGTDQGTTFTVRLPLERGSVYAVAAAEGLVDPRQLRGVRVVLVDDDDDARDALSVLLWQRGAEVRTFRSAEEAFHALRRDPPDVLLSDIAMPGEDGYSLIERVRSLPPARGGSVPAAALTAYAGAHDRARALSAGYDEHLTKPLDPGEFVDAVIRLARRLGFSGVERTAGRL